MQQFCFSFERTTVPALPADVQELIAAAKAAVQRAYAPYSNFRVGAAVRLADGTIRIGANHENASYPAGVCAERSILYTLDPTNPNEHVKAIGICYQGRPDAHEPLAPCGICRQVLLETQLTQGFPIEVYMCGPDGDVLHISDASMLLPFYFSGEHLPE